MNRKTLHAIIVATITSFVTTSALQASDLSNIVERVSVLESANPDASDNDFSGFSLPFAVAGDPKNVIILRRVNFDDTVNYFLRVRHSDGQSISVNGIPTARTHIASYGFASAPSIGSTVATLASDYIESPETTGYNDYLIESSFFDLNNNNARTIIPGGDVERWIESRVLGTNGLSVGPINVEVNGVLDRLEDFNQRYIGRVPTLTIADLVFNDVAVQQRLGSGFTRYRARGIGEIYRQQAGQQSRFAIYYRVNGQTGGSLFGTPFQPDIGNLDGLFFSP